MLMCIQNFIEISQMVEALRRFQCFNFLGGFGVALVKDNMSFGKYIGYILSVSISMPNIIKLFPTV